MRPLLCMCQCQIQILGVLNGGCPAVSEEESPKKRETRINQVSLGSYVFGCRINMEAEGLKREVKRGRDNVSTRFGGCGWLLSFRLLDCDANGVIFEAWAFRVSFGGFVFRLPVIIGLEVRFFDIEFHVHTLANSR
jgi:hypothetical protein